MNRVQLKKNELGREEGELEMMESLGDGAIFISDRSSLFLHVAFARCWVQVQEELHLRSQLLLVGAECSLESGVTKPFYKYRTTSKRTNFSCNWVVQNLW